MDGIDRERGKSGAIRERRDAIALESRLGVSLESIARFCQRWKIQELALFGSITREDFRDDSDVDFLVTFEDGVSVGLFDLYEIEDELKSLVGRDINFIFKKKLERSQNWISKKNILSSAKVIYGKG